MINIRHGVMAMAIEMMSLYASLILPGLLMDC
jgi:hypothetical protein